MAIYKSRWRLHEEEMLTHGRDEIYEFEVDSQKTRDMNVLVRGHGNIVRISGVTVHNIVEGVMANSPMKTKKAMLEHLKWLIEEEEMEKTYD